MADSDRLHSDVEMTVVVLVSKSRRGDGKVSSLVESLRGIAKTVIVDMVAQVRQRV